MKPFIAALMLLVLAIPPSHADDAFYAASVVTSDRSEAAFDEAAREAMARVLVRVSGDETVLGLPGVATALAKAAQSVALYRYVLISGQSELFVQFDPQLIKQILRRAGATYWAEQRPPVLVWLVLDEPSGRRFIDPALDSDLLSSLQQLFSERGVALRLPLLDLQDQAAITTETVWQKALPQLQMGSRRYGTDHVLVGRLVQLSGGAVLADWLYFDATGRTARQNRNQTLAAALEPGVDIAVDAMAGQYGVALGEVAVSSVLTVTIEGVESYQQYRAVTELLRGIDVLEDLQTVRIAERVVILRISGLENSDTLLKLLPKNKGLSVVDATETGRVSLSWVSQ